MHECEIYILFTNTADPGNTADPDQLASESKLFSTLLVNTMYTLIAAG